MNPSLFPSAILPLMAAASLAEDGEDLNIVREYETQGLPNYNAHIFRVILTPMMDPTAQSVQASVYYSPDHSRGEEHVALLTGNLLQRPRPNFSLEADDIDPELGMLASMFFNLDGTVNIMRNPQLAQIASRPGGFLWIHKVEVKLEHRQRVSDLGLQLVHQTLTFLRDEWTIAVIHPAPLSSRGCHWPENAPLLGDESDVPVELKLRRHFARLGFVQAGRDVGTAFAMYLTADKFFPAEKKTFRWISKEDAQNIEFCSLVKHESQGIDKQLHDFILYKGSPSSDNQYPFPLRDRDVARIGRLLRAGASVHESRALHLAARQGADAVVLRMLVRHGGDVNTPDESGNRPLHEAAMGITFSVPLLIQLGADCNVRNNNNDTPFELLEQAARVDQASVNTFEECKPKPNMRNMRNLRKAMLALLPVELKSQLIDGCLSPRLHKMLFLTALHVNTAINATTADVFESDDSCPLTDLSCYILLLEYIPADVLSDLARVAKSFLFGWGQLFAAIAESLHYGEVPTVARVRKILNMEMTDASDVDVFFEYGGRIEYALDALIGVTRNVREDRSELWSCDSFSDIEALNETPLDDLFNVVRAMCFHGCEVVAYGPYESSIDLTCDG